MPRSRSELGSSSHVPLPEPTGRFGRRSRGSAVGALLALVVLSGALGSSGCRGPSLERRLAALELAADRQDVVQLIYRYAYGLDRGDATLLETIFLPDVVAEYVGVDSSLNVRLEGVPALLAWLRETDRGRSPPGHYMATPVVEVDGDRATLHAYQHNRDLSGAGLYTLDAVRTPSGWRIAKLHLDQHVLRPVTHEE